MRLLLLAFLLVPCHALAGSIDISGNGSGSIAISYSAAGGSIAIAQAEVEPTCSGTFSSDNLIESGASLVNLSDHISIEGGTWLGASASDGSIVLNATTDEINSTDASGDTLIAYLDTEAECADYSVTASVKTGSASSSHRVGVLGRWDGFADSGYRLRIEGGGAIRLEKIVTGSGTILASGTLASFSATTYYALELRMNGSTIEGYVDGVLAVSVVDSEISEPGAMGVLLRNNQVRMTSIVGAYL